MIEFGQTGFKCKDCGKPIYFKQWVEVDDDGAHYHGYCRPVVNRGGYHIPQLIAHLRNK